MPFPSQDISFEVSFNTRPGESAQYYLRLLQRAVLTLPPFPIHSEKLHHTWPVRLYEIHVVGSEDSVFVETQTTVALLRV